MRIVAMSVELVALDRVPLFETELYCSVLTLHVALSVFHCGVIRTLGLGATPIAFSVCAYTSFIIRVSAHRGCTKCDCRVCPCTVQHCPLSVDRALRYCFLL